MNARRREWDAAERTRARGGWGESSQEEIEQQLNDDTPEDDRPCNCGKCACPLTVLWGDWYRANCARCEPYCATHDRARMRRDLANPEHMDAKAEQVRALLARGMSPAKAAREAGVTLKAANRVANGPRRAA